MEDKKKNLGIVDLQMIGTNLRPAKGLSLTRGSSPFLHNLLFSPSAILGIHKTGICSCRSIFVVLHTGQSPVA